MGEVASQITSLTIVYSIVYSDADQRKHQSSASLAFVRGIYRWPVNSPHKWPVSRKTFPFDDLIMLMIETLKRICDKTSYVIIEIGINFFQWTYAEHIDRKLPTCVYMTISQFGGGIGTVWEAPRHSLKQWWHESST